MNNWYVSINGWAMENMPMAEAIILGEYIWHSSEDIRLEDALQDALQSGCDGISWTYLGSEYEIARV